MVKIGIIGTGFGRQVHLPACLATPGASVIGVASGQPERARLVSEEFGLPRWFASWQELVESSEIDAVSIATPPALHEPIALAALAAGKAVFCEKPLASTMAEAHRMHEASQAARTPHMVSFEFRELPAWQIVKQLLSDGTVGALRHVQVTWVVQGWADPARPWSWRADGAQGGGALGAWGVHAFDYLEWLFGPIAKLTAQLGTRIPRRPDAAGQLREVTSEDCAHMLLELEDGTPVTLMFSGVAPVGIGHRVEIAGERATLLLASRDLRDYGKGFEVWEGRPEASGLRRVPIPDDPMSKTFDDGRIAPVQRLMQRFIESIQEGRLDARPSFEDGFRAQQLLEAARQSHQHQQWVNVAACAPAPTR